MKLLDRYEFTNGALFETYLLEPADTARFNVPECDVIGLRRVNEKDDRMAVLRPDEALIQAQMLIAAVGKVTSGYEIGLKPNSDRCDYCGTNPVVDAHELWCREQRKTPFATELVEDLDHAAPKG